MSSPDPKVSDSNDQSVDNNQSAKAADSSIDPPNLVDVGTIDQDSEQSKEETETGNENEEEEGECGFCLFMKGGGCKETFIAWEKCIEEAENSKEDIVSKCFEVTGALEKCMREHIDYYEPVLRAQKAAEEEAVNELEREKSVERSDENAMSNEIEQNVRSMETKVKSDSSNE